MKDKKHVRPWIWILFALTIQVGMVYLVIKATPYLFGRLFYKAPNSPATMAGALDYLESKYDRRDYELTLLKVNEVEPHVENIGGVIACIYQDVPARTETCYLGYSPQDDLYFYVFHSTDPEANSAYYTFLGNEIAQIKRFEEAKAYARTVFGNRFKGTDVQFDLYDQGFGSLDVDARSAYNRLILDVIEDPFSTSLIHINRERFLFMPILYLNVYVDCSLEELKTVMKEEALTFEEIYRYILFFANDGAYNKP